jgi:hypothetical protein
MTDFHGFEEEFIPSDVSMLSIYDDATDTGDHVNTYELKSGSK